MGGLPREERRGLARLRPGVAGAVSLAYVAVGTGTCVMYYALLAAGVSPAQVDAASAGLGVAQVEDLLVASPPTRSRVGIIYIEPNARGVDVLRESWV